MNSQAVRLVSRLLVATAVVLFGAGCAVKRKASVVAAGDHHCIALSYRGELFAWGLNDRDQLGDGTKQNRLVPLRIAIRNIVAADGGAAHTVALAADGSVWTWSANDCGQLGEGTAWAWGANASGQLGDRSWQMQLAPVRVRKPANWPPDVKFLAVAAGGTHTVALLRDGTAAAWGANWSECWQLAEGTTMNILLLPLYEGSRTWR